MTSPSFGRESRSSVGPLEPSTRHRLVDVIAAAGGVEQFARSKGVGLAPTTLERAVAGRPLLGLVREKIESAIAAAEAPRHG